MTGEGGIDAGATGAPATPETEERRLPLIELDRALAPIRRLAAWAIGRSESGGVPYLEATVDRWVGVAAALDLPEPVPELIAELRAAVAGYDAAPADVRRECLGRLYQAVARLDALLGLPLRGVPIRTPDKPRLPDWRVPEAPPAPPVVDAEPDGEADLTDLDDVLLLETGPPAAAVDDAPLVPKRRAEPKKKGPPPAPEPPPELWNGRMSVELAELDLVASHPAELAALIDAGVATVEDLLLLRPTSTEWLRNVQGAGRPLPPAPERVAVGGRVMRRWTVIRPDGHLETRAQLKGAGRVDLRWDASSVTLAAAGGIAAYHPDARVIAVGMANQVGTGDAARWELIDPEWAYEDGAGGVRLRRYDLDGVDDRWLRGWIGRLLPLATNVRDLLPQAELQRYGLESLRALLPELHHRDEERARRRLAFDEALLLQLGACLDRYRTGRDRGLPVPPVHGLLTRLEVGHDLFLDDAQQLVFEDIKRDLRRRTPMRRVLVGEPGSGRSLLALMAAVSAAEAKVQVMILCADAVEAEHRFAFAGAALKEGGLVARLVEGEPSKALRDAIARGEVHVVFGTARLLQDEIEFRKLGLVIAEEREAFGAVSAALDKLRSPRPHALIVPTVPLDPRLVLTAYADHDLSEVRTAPPAPAGGEILGAATSSAAPRVTLVPATERSVVYSRAAEAVAAGGQVIILFPLVRGTDALDIPEAARVVQALESDAFGKAKIGLFHGSMSRDERVRVIDDFGRRRLNVLVATSAVELAPAAPGAVAAILEQADRFELWRLERLRGLLRPQGSGAPVEPSIWCVCGADLDEARARLAPLLDTEPHAQRGMKRVLTAARDAKSGEEVAPAELTWIEWAQDVAMVWQARAAAHEIASRDPRLRNGWATDLARALRARWPSFYGDDVPELVLDEARAPGEASAAGAKAPGGARRRRRRRRK